MEDDRTEISAVKTKVVLVTGPSGAGRGTAIRALEDVGFEAIDNLPMTLLPRLLAGPPIGRNLALGVDPRNRDFSVARLNDLVDSIAESPDFECSLLYLDCSVEVLVARFSETRRQHPLAPGDAPLVGIEREKNILQGLMTRADTLIDTTLLTPHDLRAELVQWYGAPGEQRMAVSVQSFSYKRGLPRGVDMVLDCRFLRNPHWDADLRALDGRSDAVAAYIEDDSRFAEFFAKTHDLVEMLLPAYLEEGKSNFAIALGCTGGQHRSVCVAEKLAKALALGSLQVSIRHRELERTALGTNEKAVRA